MAGLSPIRLITYMGEQQRRYNEGRHESSISKHDSLCPIITKEVQMAITCQGNETIEVTDLKLNAQELAAMLDKAHGDLVCAQHKYDVMEEELIRLDELRISRGLDIYVKKSLDFFRKHRKINRIFVYNMMPFYNGLKNKLQKILDRIESNIVLSNAFIFASSLSEDMSDIKTKQIAFDNDQSDQKRGVKRQRDLDDVSEVTNSSMALKVENSCTEGVSPVSSSDQQSSDDAVLDTGTDDDLMNNGTPSVRETVDNPRYRDKSRLLNARKRRFTSRSVTGASVTTKKKMNQFGSMSSLGPGELLPEASVLKGKRRFCLCNLPEHGFMIECSVGRGGCNGWVHPNCCSLNIAAADADKIDIFICPLCVAWQQRREADRIEQGIAPSMLPRTAYGDDSTTSTSLVTEETSLGTMAEPSTLMSSRLLGMGVIWPPNAKRHVTFGGKSRTASSSSRGDSDATQVEARDRLSRVHKALSTMDSHATMKAVQTALTRLSCPTVFSDQSSWCSGCRRRRCCVFDSFPAISAQSLATSSPMKSGTQSKDLTASPKPGTDNGHGAKSSASSSRWLDPLPVVIPVNAFPSFSTHQTRQKSAEDDNHNTEFPVFRNNVDKKKTEVAEKSDDVSLQRFFFRNLSQSSDVIAELDPDVLEKLGSYTTMCPAAIKLWWATASQQVK